MSDTLVWLAGIVGSFVIGGIIRSVFALFRRVREAEKHVGKLEERIDGLDGGAAVGELERQLQEHRLCVAETYVRREDYVPQMSLIAAKLDAQAVTLGRLDERTRQWERPHDAG